MSDNGQTQTDRIIVDYSYKNRVLIIRFSRFKPEWKNAVSSLPKKKYDTERQVWLVPASDYYLLMKKLHLFDQYVFYSKRMQQFIKDESQYHVVDKIQEQEPVDIGFVLDWDNNTNHLLVKFIYEDGWVNLLRSCEGARWCNDEKQWKVPRLNAAVALKRILTKIQTYDRSFVFVETDEYKKYKSVLLREASFVNMVKSPRLAEKVSNKIIVGYDARIGVLTLTLGEYNPEWVEVCRSFPERYFNTELKRWEVPFKHYLPVLNALKQKLNLRTDWDVTDELRIKIKEVRAKDCDTSQLLKPSLEEYNPDKPLSVATYETPNGFYADLYGFQKDGVTMLLQGKVFLGDEQGLGKTIQLIAYCMHMRQHAGIKKVLIICPNSIKFSAWRNEIEANTDATYAVVHGTPQKRLEAIQSDAFFTIIHYEAMRLHIREIKREVLAPNGKHYDPPKYQVVGYENDFPTYDVMILDEAHRIKGHRAQTTTAVHRVNAKTKIVATGTPIMNKPDDLAPVLFLVKPDIFGAKQFKNVKSMYYHFLDMYCERKDIKLKKMETIITKEGQRITRPRVIKKVVGYKNLGDLQNKLQSVLIRRTKSEVLKELPAKIPQVHEVTLLREQAELYRQIMDEVQVIIADKQFNVNSALTKLTRCLQVIAGLEVFGAARCSAKADELELILEDFIYDGTDNKVLVFTGFTSVIDTILVPRLSKYNPAIIAGSGEHEVKDPEKRANIVDKFQMDETCKVFIGSTDACKEGLTLTAGSLVVMFDLPWDPGTYDQVTDRPHRIGQLKTVVVKDLIAQNTIEPNIRALLAHKRQMRDYLVDKQGLPPDEANLRVSSMTREEIRSLF